jgi:hypothetical protein
MEDNPKLTIENKINNNLFRFLVREYFSNQMNPFEVLRLTSKILYSKISKLVKMKYINVKFTLNKFFFTVLQRISINNESIINTMLFITNDSLDHLLTRKADYKLIIKYAIFLIQIGRIDLVLTRIQVFHFDSRFMNNGQLLFYKGLFELMLHDKSYMNNFIQSIGLTKTEEITNYEWLISILKSKMMVIFLVIN